MHVGAFLRRLSSRWPIAILAGAVLSAAGADDLSSLSDEFDDASRLTEWSRVVETEGWGNDAMEVRSADGVRPGWLRLIPRTSSWFEEWRGEMMFKSVTGDFVITTEVEPRNRAGNGAPGALYSLAGIMVRTPVAQTSPAEWSPGRQNYVFLSLGAANAPGTYQFEVKTTLDSESVLEIEPGVARATIRVARIGAHLLMLRRNEGGAWVVHRRYHRPDLPATVSAGLTVYTDWPLCESVGVAWHNTHVLTNGAPAPGGGVLSGANPDLRADFDYVRFARPAVPPSLLGVNLSNPSAASDSQLLAFLGDSADVPAVDTLDRAELMVSATVRASAPERFGFNLAYPHLNNFTLDPGFEPTLIRHSFVATGGGGDYIENNAGPTTSFFQTLTNGFFNDATVRVYRPQPSGPVQFIRGGRVIDYVVSENRILLDANGPVVQAGDYYHLDLVTVNPPRDRLDPRMTMAAGQDPWRPVGGAVWPFGLPVEVVRDDSTVAPEQGGRSSARMTAPGAHEVTLRQARFSSPDRYGGYYPALTAGRRYRVDLWMRQSDIPDGTARVFLTQHYGAVSNQFSVGTEWGKHTFTFLAPPTPAGFDGISEVCVGFTGPGTLWVDNLFLYEDEDSDPATYPALAPASQAVLAMTQFAPGPVRLWSGQANTTWGASLDSLTGLEHLQLNGWHADQGKVPPESAYTLPTALPLIDAIGGTPWIIVSPAFDESEWLGLIEYLAAPFDPAQESAESKPWAARRHAQGRNAPWADAFPRLRIEFANEAWNSHFQFTYPNGDLAGQFASYYFQVAQGSPWFAAIADKTDFIVNGWILQPEATGYGHAAALRSPEARFSDITGYLSGWEIGSQYGEEVTDTAFQDMLLFPAGWLRYFVDRHIATRDAISADGRDYRLAVYEGGPGYPLPAPGSEFHPVAEIYGKSLAAGTATLDLFLYNSSRGIDPQAYFTFQAGANWSSHTNAGGGWRPHPSWLALQLRNEEAAGDMVDLAVLQAPAAHLPASNFDGNPVPAFPNVPLVTGYAFREGDRYAVFILSRRLIESTRVTLRLPLATVTSAIRHLLTGDPRTNNLAGADVGIVTSNVEGMSPVHTFVLPPASVALFVVTGDPLTDGAGPRVAVSQAVGQADPTTDPAVRFQVVFSEPVSGFTEEDVQVVAPGDAPEVAVIRSMAHPDTLYEIIVSGLTAPGPVGIAVAAGVATNGMGLGNQAPWVLDSRVTFGLPSPEDRRLAHDGFDLAPATLPHPPFLHEAPGGEGWAEPWLVQNFDADYAGGYRVAASTPLSFDNLLTTVGYAVGGRLYETASRRLDVSGAFAGFEVFGIEPPTLGRSGRSLWISALLRKDSAQWVFEGPSLHFVDGPFAWDFSNSRLAFGFFGSASLQGGIPYWSLAVRNPAGDAYEVIRSDVPIVVGEAVLMVARVDFATLDRVNVFINPPDLGMTAPPVPNLTWTATADHPDVRFRSVGWYGGPSQVTGDVEGSLDEVRLGDSFASVTPVRLAVGVTWEEWRQGWAWPAPSEGAAESDPDDDDATNLEEYATGGNPLANDGGASNPIIARQEGEVLLRLTLDVTAREALTTLESSDDLVEWEPEASYSSTGSELVREAGLLAAPANIEEIGTLRRVTEYVSVAPAGVSYRFYRVRFALQ